MCIEFIPKVNCRHEVYSAVKLSMLSASCLLNLQPAEWGITLPVVAESHVYWDKDSGPINGLLEL